MGTSEVNVIHLCITLFIPRGRRPWRPSPATRRWCRGVRFLLPQPSILPSARRQRSSPSQSGCCRGGGSAGPQGPVGPAASPPSPSAVPTSAQEIQPPGGGRASTARWGRRAPRAKGGLSPCGPGERGGGGRQGAAEATAGSLPPALGRGPGGAQAGLRCHRRHQTNPAAWKRSPQRLTNRKRLTSGAEGGARLRLRPRRDRGLRQSEHSLPRSRRLSGRAQAHFPGSPPQPLVSASSAAWWSRVRRQPKRTELKAPVAKRSAWRGSSVPSAAAAGAAAAA